MFDLLIADYNGEKIPFLELVERLKFRQDKRRKLGIPVDVALTISACYQGHFSFTGEKSEDCLECGEKYRYRIIKGILEVTTREVLNPRPRKF